VILDAEKEAYLEEQRKEERLRREAAEKVGEEYVAVPFKKLEVDEVVVEQRRAGLLLTLVGHSAAVTALAINERVLVSGSTDRVVLVWDPRDGHLLRRLRSHDSTISTISIDDTFFATGSFDCQVRLWRISQFSERNPAQVVDLVRRYKGHAAHVTCSFVAGDEAVTGDADGVIIVWDRAADAPLRVHRVHEAGFSVNCLQFDSSKIVSAGMDRRLVFTDLSSGAPMQVTKNAHGASPILALQFDLDCCLTLARDRTMRMWGLVGGEAVPAIHTVKLMAGMKLNSVARMYGVSLTALLQWNNLKDAKVSYEGMPVTVAPRPSDLGYLKALTERDEVERMKRDKEVGQRLVGADEAELVARAKEVRDRRLAVEREVIASNEASGLGGPSLSTAGGGGGLSAASEDDATLLQDYSPPRASKSAAAAPAAGPKGTPASPTHVALPPLSLRDHAMFKLAEEVATTLRVRPPLPEKVEASEFLSEGGAGSELLKMGIKARRLALQLKADKQVEQGLSLSQQLVTAKRKARGQPVVGGAPGAAAVGSSAVNSSRAPTTAGAAAESRAPTPASPGPSSRGAAPGAQQRL
jgi:LysM repeat protein